MHYAMRLPRLPNDYVMDTNSQLPTRLGSKIRMFTLYSQGWFTCRSDKAGLPLGTLGLKALLNWVCFPKIVMDPGH